MRGRGGVGAYKDGPFVAALSEMWVCSRCETRGDGSLYHSAVRYWV